MDSFLAYIQQLELMFFFSAYPLVYAIVILIAGSRRHDTTAGRPAIKDRMLAALTYAYALVGTLYLGFLLKNMNPDYSPDGIRRSIHLPLLVSWGILSILFWLPFLAKKKVLALLHSLVFFFFVIRDVFLQLFGSVSDKDMVRNDMKLFTDSFLLNAGALVAVMLFSFFLRRKVK